MSEHPKMTKNCTFKMEYTKENLKKVGKKQQKTRFFRVTFWFNCFKLSCTKVAEKNVFFCVL